MARDSISVESSVAWTKGGGAAVGGGGLAVRILGEDGFDGHGGPVSSIDISPATFRAAGTAASVFGIVAGYLSGDDARKLRLERLPYLDAPELGFSLGIGISGPGSGM